MKKYAKRVLKRIKGFTLVEILVVIGILVVLFTIVLLAINIPRQMMQANDTKRKSDVAQLKQSISEYFIDKKTLPSQSLWFSIPCENATIPDSLKSYLSNFLCDPTTKNHYFYETLDAYCQPCVGDSCTAFRILTPLQNTEDRSIQQIGCSKEEGCGAFDESGTAYNYGTSFTCPVNNNLLAWESAQTSLSQDKIAPASQILELSLAFDIHNSPPLSINNLTIKSAYESYSQVENPEYTTYLIDENGQTLVSLPFNVPRTMIGTLPGDDPVPASDQAQFVLNLPWNENAKNLLIRDANNQIVINTDIAQIPTMQNQPNYYSVLGNAGGATNQQTNSNLIKPAHATTDNYVDITFIGDGFYTKESLTTYHKKVSSFIKYFLSYEPFKSRAAQIYFHYVDNTTNLGCLEHGEHGLWYCQGPALSIINSAGVPHDNVYIVLNAEEPAGAYANIAYGGNDLLGGGPTFLHEFAHSFASIEDEYVYSNPPETYSGKVCYNGNPPNPAWEGIVPNDSYFLGCSAANWYRSTENSIIRDHKTAFYYNYITQKHINDQINLVSGINKPYYTPTPIKKVCFCHNVNNNPETICTGLQAEINGHTSHVNNGIDTRGECFQTPTITVTPTSSPISQTITPTPTSPLPSPTIGVNPGCSSYTYDSYWGTLVNGLFVTASGDGQFAWPFATAIDASGNIYVSDNFNFRVQKFTSDHVFIKKWGTPGTDPGQFNGPWGISTSPSGSIYVVEHAGNRVQKFTSDGTFILMWGSKGSGDGQFYFPQYITTDAAGNVYVSDTGNNRVQKFDANGNFLTKWGDVRGNLDGQFKGPNGIVVSSTNKVYVADYSNHRIQIFDTNGNFISKFGVFCDNGYNPLLCLNPYQFSYPIGLDIDASDNLYIMDKLNNRVHKYDANLNLITIFGSYATNEGALGQFRMPTDIKLDRSGNIYINDSNRYHIQKFRCASSVTPTASPVSPTATPTPTSVSGYSVGGNLTDCDTHEPLVGIPVTVFRNEYSRDGSVFLYPITDANGHFSVPGWSLPAYYAVRGASLPPGYASPPSTTTEENTMKNGCYWATDNTPLGSVSYECQNAGYYDCAGPDSTGKRQRCDLCFHKTTPTPTTPPSPTPTQVQIANCTSYVPSATWGYKKWYESVSKWLYVNANEGFDYIEDITFDRNYNSVYIADAANWQIQKLDSDMNPIAKWPFPTLAASPGERRPYGVAVDSQGYVYVVEGWGSRIDKFDASGNQILTWGTRGSGIGQLETPNSIAVDSFDYIYVTDYSNHRIQKFDTQGNYISSFGSYGSGNGQFKNPTGIFITPQNILYVTDSNNHRVQVFNTNGQFITKWGSYGDVGTSTSKVGLYPGQFAMPDDVYVDPQGNIFVADYLNNRVQKFDTNGNFITMWGLWGDGLGTDEHMEYINGTIAVTGDLQGNIYVGDKGHGRITKFQCAQTINPTETPIPPTQTPAPSPTSQPTPTPACVSDHYFYPGICNTARDCPTALVDGICYLNNCSYTFPNDIYNQGTVVTGNYWAAYGRPAATYKDTCTGNTMVEYQCSGNPRDPYTIGSGNYICPKGCDPDGTKCIR